MNILFYIVKAYSIPIIKPLVVEAEKQCINYYFFASEIVEKNFPKEWSKNRIVKFVSEVKKLGIDFTLCPGNYVDFRIPGRKVQIFHGLGVEKESHYKIRDFFDIYCTSGPYVTNKFKEIAMKKDYFIVIETGWPKVDYIINYDASEIRNVFNFPEDKKIILFAPTFSPKMESASDLIDIIPNIIKEDEFWIFKFHDLMNKDIIAKFEKKLPDNTSILPSGDITPYLHVADLMISDTSSVVYEFMLLNKPVITYKAVSRIEKTTNITNKDQLRKAIDGELGRKDCNHFANEYLLEANPYLDGTISKRVFDGLKDIKENDIHPVRKKPLNLFRKCQVLKNSMLKKGYLR